MSLRSDYPSPPDATSSQLRQPVPPLVSPCPPDYPRPVCSPPYMPRHFRLFKSPRLASVRLSSQFLAESSHHDKPKPSLPVPHPTAHGAPSPPNPVTNTRAISPQVAPTIHTNSAQAQPDYPCPSRVLANPVRLPASSRRRPPLSDCPAQRQTSRVTILARPLAASPFRLSLPNLALSYPIRLPFPVQHVPALPIPTIHMRERRNHDIVSFREIP